MSYENEVAVIGMGPAGVSAAIYLKRYGMEPVCFEKGMVGGKTNFTDRIENYPGFIGEKGSVLSSNLASQLKDFGIEPVYKSVKELSLNEDGSFLLKYGKVERNFRYVIIANGLTDKPLHLEGEESFRRRGISSCAICDGPLYKEKDVAVVGGGNSAFQEANYLATICNRVYLVSHHRNLKAQEKNINTFNSFGNTELLVPYEPVACTGTNSIESLVLEHNETHERKEIRISGLFVYIGNMPVLDYLKIEGLTNERGYITANPASMETKVKNLYAVGDCRDTPLRQVTTAVSDGSLAATSIHADYMDSVK